MQKKFLVGPLIPILTDSDILASPVGKGNLSLGYNENFGMVGAASDKVIRSLNKGTLEIIDLVAFHEGGPETFGDPKNFVLNQELMIEVRELVGKIIEFNPTLMDLFRVPGRVIIGLSFSADNYSTPLNQTHDILWGYAQSYVRMNGNEVSPKASYNYQRMAPPDISIFSNSFGFSIATNLVLNGGVSTVNEILEQISQIISLKLVGEWASEVVPIPIDHYTMSMHITSRVAPGGLPIS